jgi:hypothetical protein
MLSSPTCKLLMRLRTVRAIYGPATYTTLNLMVFQLYPTKNKLHRLYKGTV